MTPEERRIMLVQQAHRPFIQGGLARASRWNEIKDDPDEDDGDRVGGSDLALRERKTKHRKGE